MNGINRRRGKSRSLAPQVFLVFMILPFAFLVLLIIGTKHRPPSKGIPDNAVVSKSASVKEVNAKSGSKEDILEGIRKVDANPAKNNSVIEHSEEAGLQSGKVIEGRSHDDDVHALPADPLEHPTRNSPIRDTVVSTGISGGSPVDKASATLVPKRGPIAYAITIQNAPQVPMWTPRRTTTHANITSDLPVLEGSFEIPSSVYGIGKVTCFYVIPMDGKIPASSAPDIVVRFGWIGQQALPNGESRALATRYGFTVLTIQWPVQPGVDWSDREKFSLYPESGSGPAWLAAIDGVRQIGRLPSRKIFALGFSAGASAAHQFVEAYPEMAEAVVAIAGRTFESKPIFTGPYLLMHSDRDRVEENASLEKALQFNHSAVTHLTYPPDWEQKGKSDFWAHNGNAWGFAFEWISGLAEQRLHNNGKLESDSQWMVADGMHLPSAACAEQLHSLPLPPRIDRDVTTQNAIIVAGPRKGIASSVDCKGTIWWMDRRYAVEIDDVLAPSELLSLKGYRVYATNCDGQKSNVQNAFSQLLRTDKFTRPSCMVLIYPKLSDIAYIEAMAPKISCLVLLRASRGSVVAISKAVMSIRAKAIIQTEESNIESLPDEIKTSRLIKFIPQFDGGLAGDVYRNEVSVVESAFPNQ